MSLPLCTPEKLECVNNIEVNDEGYLPQCSGFWMEFTKNSDGEGLSKEKIIQVSKQYWNYKGFYKFSSYSGKKFLLHDSCLIHLH